MKYGLEVSVQPGDQISEYLVLFWFVEDFVEEAIVNLERFIGAGYLFVELNGFVR